MHLKKYIRGADFDLEAIWEEHTYFEFADRSAAKTMGTMVQEPYVNHVPTVSPPYPLSSSKIHVVRMTTYPPHHLQILILERTNRFLLLS